MPQSDLDSAAVYAEIWAYVQPESSRRLLMSALDCFATKGFAGTSTREIADRAGMSPAGLYVHYRSKTDLLFEISRIGHEHMLHVIASAAAGAVGPTQRLLAYVDSYAMTHARLHTLARVNNYELYSLREEQLEVIRETRRRIQGHLDAILRAGLDSGEFEILDRRGTVRAILSLGIDVARWYTEEGPLRPEDVGALYAGLALRMVGGRSEAMDDNGLLAKPISV